MHYHIATFQELERRIVAKGGEFILVSGEKNNNETGRVGISETVVRQHLFIPYKEWICGTYTLRSQPSLPSLIERMRPDVVIVMGHVGSLTYWRLGKLAKKLGFNYVTWQCGYEYNSGSLKHELTKRFFKLFDYHLAYNTNAKKYLVSNGVSGSRITVIHNTINEQQITLLPRTTARQMVTDELQLPPDRPIILYVGAILMEKRLDVLIEAVRRLAPRILTSLVIVGDGPALADLKTVSADLQYIRYPGRVVEGVGRFFDAADVFVLPGTGGLAINEAMTHGLPVISAFADGSAVDLITDGVNGYILSFTASTQDVAELSRDSAHAEEIALRLESILSDAEHRSRMGATSRKLITTKHSFAAFIDRILKGLDEASGDASRRLRCRTVHTAVERSNI
jgi:glycosyltransferase involved in cell wall biosynthesis